MLFNASVLSIGFQHSFRNPFSIAKLLPTLKRIMNFILFSVIHFQNTAIESNEMQSIRGIGCPQDRHTLELHRKRRHTFYSPKKTLLL